MGAGATNGKLIFNLAVPTAEEAEAGVKTGAIKLENAILNVGSTGIVPTVTKDANSETGTKYWDLTAKTWN